jgi:polar amino acid transport system permease protein
MSDMWTALSWGANGWSDELAEGLAVTVSLAVATLPVGLVLGLVVALAKRSSAWPLRLIGNAYTTVFRGLPELLTLFIIYYGVQIGIQALVEALFEDADPIEINTFVAGMVALGVVFSAYASEVFLSAFKGITQGQIEAARALGLGRGATFRLIILPQLVRYALPGIANLWLVLLKDTSLVSAIGLSDILRNTQIAVGVTKQPLVFFGLACLIYLVLAIISSFGVNAIEARAERGTTRSRL